MARGILTPTLDAPQWLELQVGREARFPGTIDLTCFWETSLHFDYFSSRSLLILT